MQMRAKSFYDTARVAANNWSRIEGRVGKDLAKRFRRISDKAIFTKDVLRLLDSKAKVDTIIRRINRATYERCTAPPKQGSSRVERSDSKINRHRESVPRHFQASSCETGRTVEDQS